MHRFTFAMLSVAAALAVPQAGAFEGAAVENAGAAIAGVVEQAGGVAPDLEFTDDGPATWSDERKEQFLLNAKVIKVRGTKKGITGTSRVTMSDGVHEHDAHVQTIDMFRDRYETPLGMEMNFKDTWKFNVAAYKLAKMLGIDMIPATVERKFQGSSASYTWWVDDVIMDEGDRRKKKLDPPQGERWNEEMWVVRVFDQLIHNMDRNLGNLLIDKDWRIWMIDHSRAFRRSYDLKEPANLTKCDRGLMAKLKELDAAKVKQELGRYLMGAEIEGLLKRRDRIVAHFEKNGPAAMYEISKR